MGGGEVGGGGGSTEKWLVSSSKGISQRGLCSPRMERIHFFLFALYHLLQCIIVCTSSLSPIAFILLCTRCGLLWGFMGTAMGSVRFRVVGCALFPVVLVLLNTRGHLRGSMDSTRECTGRLGGFRGRGV